VSPRVPAAVVPPGGLFAPRELPGGEIHVWQAELDAGVPGGDVLSAPERARRDRMAARAAVRFARSRTLLRRLLAAYTGEPARSIGIVLAPEGKPRVDRGEVRFNLAHSGSAWIAAFASDRDVGVDVERVDREVDRDGVAARLFAPGEMAAIRRLSGAAKTLAFFRCWTAREAIVKARGEGVFTLASSFEVEADPDRPFAVRFVRGEDAAWWVAEVPARAGCLAVVAAEREPSLVRSFLGAGSGAFGTC
jgi:4'-phosphopantetheinyl transferase